MSYVEFIKSIATASGSTQISAREKVANWAIAIIDDIADKGKCVVPGLGTFKATDTKARTVTVFGKTVEVPAGKRISLKAGKGAPKEGSIVEDIINAVAKDGKLRIPGFGTFSMRDYKARTARNPRTGETMEVPARTKLVFKARFAKEI